MVTRSPFLSPIFSFTLRGMYILSLWYLVSFKPVSYPKGWVIDMGCGEMGVLGSFFMLLKNINAEITSLFPKLILSVS